MKDLTVWFTNGDTDLFTGVSKINETPVGIVLTYESRSTGKTRTALFLFQNIAGYSLDGTGGFDE